MEWQPIETAPVDELVLCDFGPWWDGSDQPFKGKNIWCAWQTEYGTWYGDHHSSWMGTTKETAPLRWMRLPD